MRRSIELGKQAAYVELEREAALAARSMDD